eukprot:TRINITY_DN18657_c0_g1_i1.p2 TRINITY_DN18657_c0_g1~~TRINITY_DN18657_c0_g1_i1.p2  ORF type:complete len:235 (-),score=54.64 TRINITY_DN18657_c0_g1_i1:712-1416(-)
MSLLGFAPVRTPKQTAAKRTRKEGDDMETDLEEDVQGKVASLVLATAAGLAAVRAVVFDVVLLPADTAIAKAALSATKNYHKELMTIEKKDRAKHGPPYTRVWQALVQECLNEAERASNPAVKNHYIPFVAHHVDEIKGIPQEADRMQYLMEIVRHCTASLTYKQDMVKITVSVCAAKNVFVDKTNIEDAWIAMIRIMMTVGGVKKRGQAPKGSLERAVAKVYGVQVDTKVENP